MTDLETMTLKEFFKKAIRYNPYDLDTYLSEAFDVRFCDECGKAFWDGYYDNGDYYCEECLPYTSHYWIEKCNNDDECYWSEWGDDSTKKVVAAYNEALDELRRDKNVL